VAAVLLSRVFLAFVVAPLAAAALLWSLMRASREPLSVAFFVSALVYAYIVAGVLVVPADTLISSRSLRAPYGNALIGALAGLVPAGLLYVVTAQIFLMLAIVMASAFGGLVFGLIAGRNLIVRRVRERR
jgi:hypothetical protein